LSKYEGILDKIAPTLYKFSQYAKYFRSNHISVNNFLNFYADISGYYSSNKISYALIEKNKVINYDGLPYIVYLTISLSELNGFVFDQNYGLNGFITTMVINNFSFEDKKLIIRRAPLYLSIPAKDLFVRVVGQDMYETLRANTR